MRLLSSACCNWPQNIASLLFAVLTLTMVCNVYWQTDGTGLDYNVTNQSDLSESRGSLINSTGVQKFRLKRDIPSRNRQKTYDDNVQSPYHNYVNQYAGINIENDPYGKNLVMEKATDKETVPSEYDEISIFCERHIAGNKTNMTLNATDTSHSVNDHSQKCAKERNGSAPVLWIMLYIIIVLFLFIGLAGICDDFFVPSLEAISDKLHLSKDVAGATFMAAGSSAPEIFTSITAIGVGSDVGVGTIVGSAVFNLLIIVALTAALAGKVLSLDWRPFIRDSIFYGASVIALLIFSWDAKFYYWESLFLLILYSLYIVVMKFNSVLMAHMGQIKCGENFELNSDDGKIESNFENDVECESQTSASSQRHESSDECEIPSTSNDTSQHNLQAAHQTKHVSFQRDSIVQSDSEMEEQPAPTPAISRATSLPSLRQKSCDSTGRPLPRLQSIKLCFDEHNLEVTIPNATLPTPIYFINEESTPRNSKQYCRSQTLPADGSTAPSPSSYAWSANSNGNNNLYDEVKPNNDNNNNSTSTTRRSSLAVLEIEEQVETMQVFPCLPNIQHSKPVRPTSSECLPGTRFVFAYVMFLLALPWICAFTWTIPNCRKPEGKKWYMVSFTFSIVWIAIISYYMVELVEKVGCLLGIDSYTMGLVVVAVGTSVPDAISSVLVAREGYGDMAVSNAMGSNVFDINLGLGLPFFIGNIVTMKPVALLSPLQQCIFDAVPLSIKIVPHTKFAFILLLILVIAVAFLILVRFKLNRILGTLFVGMYGVFLIYAFVQEKVCHGLYC